jgi:hypothetical protein
MFLSISLPLSRNLTPSLSYQIVRKRIAKVTDFLSFCPFGISIFPFCTIGISMYQKRILPYFIIPYFLTPSFFPFGALRTDRFQHPPIPYFFFFSTERAGPYPQAQLYWAGRTMGWMADWTSTNHKLGRTVCNFANFGRMNMIQVGIPLVSLFLIVSLLWIFLQVSFWWRCV